MSTMPPKFLSVSDDSQVTSPSFIEVDITPTTRLMIFSGIAAPELNIDDDEESLETDVFVNLGQYVSSLDSAVSEVGLASIANGESAFILATDSGTVDFDKTTGELFLKVHTVVSGEKTFLHRFGYQVVAKATKVASQISGTIRVPPILVDLTNKTQAMIEPMFRIRANRIEPLPPTPDPPPIFIEPKLTPLIDGRIVGTTHVPGGDSFVKYEINGCPFNTPLRVTVEVTALLENLRADPTTAQDRINLTSFAPTVSGVDFAIVRLPLG